MLLPVLEVGEQHVPQVGGLRVELLARVVVGEGGGLPEALGDGARETGQLEHAQHARAVGLGRRALEQREEQREALHAQLRELDSAHAAVDGTVEARLVDEALEDGHELRLQQQLRVAVRVVALHELRERLDGLDGLVDVVHVELGLERLEEEVDLANEVMARHLPLLYAKVVLRRRARSESR